MSDAHPPVEWGSHPEHGKRRPCPEDPVLLLGKPIGMYHCPYCGDMQLAGLPHLPPDDAYEAEYGQSWPAGYDSPTGAP